jgi:hypothetical protein
LELRDVGEFHAVTRHSPVVIWIPPVAVLLDVARFKILAAVGVTSRIASERRLRIEN